MKLRLVGFFKELRHGLPDGPSLAQSARPVAAADEAKMVRYLGSATTFIASPGVVQDVLKPGRPIGTASILTDGVWAWPADLPYYVGNYHVELSVEFVSRMRQRDWAPPTANEIALEALEL